MGPISTKLAQSIFEERYFCWGKFVEVNGDNLSKNSDEIEKSILEQQS